MNAMQKLCNEQTETMNTTNAINILIVDDDIDILHAIRDILELEELPCQINIADNVSDAIEISKATPPDIAILDIKIGKDNGLNLVPELKEINRDVSCIMITAFRDTEYAISAIRFGAHDFIYKPVEPVKIIKTIENLINNKTLEKERSKLERRFETIFEQSQQWLFILSSNGILVNANQAALDAIETDTDTIHNKYLWDTPWWSNSLSTQQLIKSSIKNTASGKSCINEISLTNSKNIKNYYELTIKPIVSDTNITDQILVECRDITTRKTFEENISKFNKELENKVKERTMELRQSISLLEREVEFRKRAEIELIEQKDKAEEANKAKSEFLSRMSHELRTPLNAILGFGQLLELDAYNTLTPDQAGNLHEIINAGNHLLEMINDILELSKIDQGDYALQIEPMNIKDIITASLSSLRHTSENNGFRIINNIEENFILADYTAIKQVLDHIIANSIYYNKNSSDIIIESTITDYNYLKITFNDAGPGIEKELCDNLFTPFERLSTTMFDTEGPGIGLAISQNLMALMHGKTGISSTIGKGTCFWLELPLSKN
ncbi:MAG: response regulator [Gammaproteobacteria bacterium]|nr:response regulator [Gammaproteobacteria bacterium]